MSANVEDTIISNSPDETRQIASSFVSLLVRGDVIALTGELGAGKTQFVQGLAKGLGFQGTVSSPTFTLIHEYTGGKLPLFHADFFRLDSLADALQIGIEDYLCADGVTAIEWAEKFPSLLPDNCFHVSLECLEEHRRRIVFGIPQTRK